MRRVWMLSVVLLAGSLAAARPVLQTEYSHVRIVRLSLVEGDVQIAQPGEADWQTALQNMPIPHGSALATGSGHAEVEFENGTTVWLAGNSLLEFTELALVDGARITRLRLTQGTATFYGNPSREDRFVVNTPHVEMVLQEKGTFRVDVDAQETAVSVWNGELEVLTAAGNYTLRKGRSLIFGSDMRQALVERNPNEDAWDRWVEARRNHVLTGRNQVGRYLSAGYAYGLHDLWHYGYWFTLPGFGHCWRPWGVSHAWSPFSFGRWVYYPGWGLTWISFEPWGWVPYHFGSWYY
ncbi:MAG: FecR family protein, partial [Firmicutes bacterium]|nr:FecR family protein [Bacillota bacterium]